MNPLFDYLWPSFMAGVVIGAAALTIVFRRQLDGFGKWLWIDGAMVAAVLASLIWSGPLGGGHRFIATVEPAFRETLDYYEMTKVTARLGRAPLNRQVILEGPANDLQQSELVRIMGELPGVSSARWGATGGGIPIILEGALVALAGLLLGFLLAFLYKLHRIHMAEMEW